MCGLAGLWAPAGIRDRVQLLRVMLGELQHRGPDACDHRIVEPDGPILGHTRLAIQDLTAAGDQPMTSRCGRFCIVLNGEIYNHWELRREIGNTLPWRGRSDTETLVEGIATWGVTETLTRVNGMFAFAVWDAVERTLVLARDRIGEKPLYWGVKEGCFCFSSELRPIIKSDLGPFPIDHQALDALLNLGYIPDPLSILLDFRKLEPGAVLEVCESGGEFELKRRDYWRLSEVMARALKQRPHRTEGEWIEEVDAALQRAVRLRLLSDVPLGAFLSGGVDSSLIVAMMSRISATPVKTFTIAMPGGWDESPRARRMADHLGTVHTEIPISEQDCLDVIPELPRVYGEPLGDSSQVPTYLVSKIARRDVTVALSGDGGDELFAGYHRHFVSRAIWRRLGKVPLGFRSLADDIQQSNLGRASSGLTSRLAAWMGAGDMEILRFQKLLRLAGARDIPDLYRRLVTQWPGGRAPTDSPVPWILPLPSWPTALEHADMVEQFMAYDLQLALPGDMLVKLDRASMAHSLEARVPFLDHEFIELALQVPIDLKARGGKGKALLRQVLANSAPPGWMDEPAAGKKVGFGVPIADWLRGPLREWAEALLEPGQLSANPALDPTAVRRAWDAFLKGREALEHPIWSLLSLQAWVQEYRPALSVD